MNRYLDIPTEEEVRWLLDQGLTEESLIEPEVIRAATVCIDGSGVFDFSSDGERAFVFVVKDNGKQLDLVAWQSTEDVLATWRGAAFALGQDSIFNPASFFCGAALKIHRSPLEWLSANREGIVIVRSELTYAYLRNAPQLRFSDLGLARQVEHWLMPPRATVKLLLEIEERGAA